MADASTWPTRLCLSRYVHVYTCVVIITKQITQIGPHKSSAEPPSAALLLADSPVPPSLCFAAPQLPKQSSNQPERFQAQAPAQLGQQAQLYGKQPLCLEIMRVVVCACLSERGNLKVQFKSAIAPVAHAQPLGWAQLFDKKPGMQDRACA